MLQPRLPDWIASAQGRASATEINSVANTSRDRTATVTATGAMIPIVYGRASVAGLTFAIGKIGTDLVIGYIWCIGEIDAIENIYINDEDVPAGVTVTNYLGTPTQGVDPTLASAITAYADTQRVDTPDGKRGIAYSVLQIPEGEISGFPKVRAVIRGRKIYDPRTDTVTYSDTPSLCFADMVTDKDYGLGSSITSGLTECANWNDSLLGEVIPRARLSLVITQGRPITDYLKILAEYSECWYTYEGGGIKMTPDSTVDLNTVDIVTAKDIVKGSMTIERVSSIDTPTEVEVLYTIPTGNSDPWVTDSVVNSIAGVSTGEVPRIPTTVSLEGIYRVEEAQNRSLSRLNRMQDRVKVSWTTFDYGVILQVGDVVVIDNPVRGVNSLPARILGVQLTSAGRYQVSAEKYDPSHYPSEIETSGDGLVPVGAIGLLDGDVVPSGWEYFSDADGKYIVAAGDTFSVGSTGGTGSVSFTGTTTTNPTHTGALDIPVVAYVSNGGSEIANWYPSIVDKVGHSHTYSSEVFTPNPLRRRNKLVIKTGTVGLKIPKEVLTFGLDNIVDGDAQRTTIYGGRLLEASDSNLNIGIGTQSISITTDNAEDSHNHGLSFNSGLSSFFDFGNNTYYQTYNGGSLHNHVFNLVLSISIKKYQLALYGGTNEYSVKAGRMFLWAGDVNNLPTDYVIVEDIKDHFIEIAGAITQPPSGDNTISISGDGSVVGHSHKGASSITNKTVMNVPHDETEYHTHSISEQIPWLPDYYTLAVIQYQPVD